MFTGIVEALGKLEALRPAGSGLDMVFSASFARELKVDQSVSHNGVCLTVVELLGDRYRVTVVKETLERSMLGRLQVGDQVNLERSLRIGDRLDGHLVQGHVDACVEVLKVQALDGSWDLTLSLPPDPRMLVEKGSICLNGVSLTIAELSAEHFRVAVIPYTYEHTNFNRVRVGDAVNVEYDLVGRYVWRMMRDPI